VPIRDASQRVTYPAIRGTPGAIVTRDYGALGMGRSAARLTAANRIMGRTLRAALLERPVLLSAGS